MMPSVVSGPSNLGAAREPRPVTAPGEAVTLPFVWPASTARARSTLKEPPRSGKLPQRKPWLFFKFLAGDV